MLPLSARVAWCNWEVVSNLAAVASPLPFPPICKWDKSCPVAGRRIQVSRTGSRLWEPLGKKP